MRLTAWRLVVGYLAMVATVPYLALKISWVSGGTIGMNDPAYFDTTTYQIGNLVTIGMDAVAVAVAAALTFRWGQRIPAWLVLFPIWVATGFLAPIAVLTLLPSASSSATTQAVEPLANWVFTVVYAGFAIQGVLLMTAFVLAAVTRWPSVFSQRLAGAPRSTAQTLLLLITAAAVLLATVVAGFQWAWAFGVRTGLPDQLLKDGDVTARLSYFGGYGVFTLTSIVGVTLLAVRKPERTRLWIPLAATWLGSSAMFAWGSWQLATMTAQAEITTPGYQLLTFLQVLAGVLMAIVVAFIMNERYGADHPSSTSTAA
ncbi:hypothetical protein ACFCV3_39465 [Kribbella sp. NPDC056345]|uniref:hypothetical protein n=1 Tax=Kribbella sp. NPDC056345 TaxID=3345789 RepID=UPI0035DDAB9E